MAACSQKCVQEHINDLPVRQEHVNRFWAHARYREHVNKLEFAYLRRSSLIKHTLTTTIIIANASEATNCPIAAAGIGCKFGHGSMKLARHALNIQTTVREEIKK